MTIFEKVAEFHKAFDIEMFDTLTKPSSDLQELRIRLLTEEYNELLEAYEQKDIVEIADALADITYIICGTAISYGIVPNGWEPPYDENEIKAIPNEFDAEIEMHMTLLDLLFEAYLRYEKHNHFDGVRDSMCSMLMEVCYLAPLFGVPFKEVFDAVHESNMLKLDPETKKPIRRADNKIIKPKNWTPPDIKSILYPT